MDKTSLRLPDKSLALELVKFYTDLNMRRSFFSSILPFKPDVILFLGDYFDGGPYLLDEEWQESLNRFKHIFGLNAQGKYTDKEVYYIPGNHDIGYE
ncbi:calcineurin-like metallo-phosphoesterase superfamily protein, partial [Trifolium medium]|nr:calcineurin-like metallo-phosphoesterase superfamily protein [Trifolium medium]